jgi:glycosyltransferase involved in cell wall biosynthesis
MRVLFVISRLAYGGAAKQLTLLAGNLPVEQYQRRVCAIGVAEGWSEALRAAGVTVDSLNRRWRLDLTAFTRLRNTLNAYQPDVLHVWGRSALRLVALAGGLRQGKLIVSLAGSVKRRPKMAWWDRRLLCKAARVTVSGQAEADHLRALGLESDRVAVIAPGVEVPASSPTAGLEPNGDVATVLCIGPLKRHKGYRDAIWVLDMLRFVHPQARLLVAGSGPDQHAIERFAQVARVTQCVQFLGEQPDLPAVLARAAVVWVPSLAPGGVNAALEAMAAGKPVVATRVPGLAELVVDGETGFLVAPGDQAALARQTRLLLDDPQLRQRLGEAGHRRVADSFSASATVQRFRELYEQI